MQWMVALSSLAVAAGVPATAGQADQSPNIAQRPCLAAETRPATIADIAALGDAAIGRCFAVEGVATGFWLYADNAARYRRAPADNEPSSSGAVLGLYGRDRGLPPARVRVTGRIDRCERIYAAVQAEGGIPFLTGYCHYYRGLALHGRTVEEIAPYQFTRVTERDAGDLGSLRPLADGQARRRLLAAATPFFEAIDWRDDAALRDLLMASRQQQESRTAALSAHPAVEQWRASGQVSGRALAVLGWHRPADATPEQQAQWARDAADGPEAYVCSASITFAELHLWPISSADTAILAGRPYLCVRIWLPDGRPPSYYFEIDRYPEAAAREPAP